MHGELDDYSFCKDDYMWNSTISDFECNKACNIDKYLGIENCLCGKCLFHKVVLACKDEISNTTETSPDYEKSNKRKNNYFIHII